MIYSDFGAHLDEHLIFGIQQSKSMTSEISSYCIALCFRLSTTTINYANDRTYYRYQT
jgi:hypothetical protein